MMTPRTTAVLLAAAVSFSLCMGVAPDASDGPEIRLEDTGARRKAKDELTLKPFDAALWGKLDGATINPDDFKGKPVLLVTWSAWYKGSHQGLTIAQQLADKYSKDGLVVIGIHHPQGFDKAADVLKERKVTFTSAHDTTGAFREALFVDQDPDFYVIDRAGNLRFADIETSSVADAVAKVMGETAEDAAALPGKLAGDAADAEAKKWKTTDAAPLPGTYRSAVAFELPDAREYDKVKWPDQNKGNAKNELEADNFQGKSCPAEFGKEEYIGDRQPDRKGKVVLIWMCEINRFGTNYMIQMLENIQSDFPADVAVIGIASDNEAFMRKFNTLHPVGFALAFDLAKTMYTAFKVKEEQPYFVVLSTDGIVRWQGSAIITTARQLRQAVEGVVKVDPGVKARQDAEKAASKATPAKK